MMKVSRAGLDLIKKWEGCRLTAYQDSVGVWTIGYGVTTNAGLGVIKRGMKITQKQADEWLLKALAKYEQTVSETLTRNPTQNQFDACVALCYNIGQAAFAKSSIVRRFNAGNVNGAADAFMLWTKADGRTLQGLVNRRTDERSLFLAPQKPAQPVSPPPEPVQPKPVSPPPAAPAPSLWARLKARFFTGVR